MRIMRSIYFFSALSILFLTSCGGGNSNSEPANDDGNTSRSGNQELVVLSTNPSDGQGNVSTSKKIEIAFNQEVDTNSLNLDTVVLHNMNSHKQINTKISYNPVTNIATLNPAILEYENHYMLRINQPVLSKTGKSMAAAIDVSFFTEFKPPLFLQEPSNGEADVNTRAVIRVSFDKTIDPATINTSSFYIEDTLSNRITGTVTMTDDTAVFEPATEMNLATEYIAVLSNTIKDSLGLAISNSDISWRFTTKATRSSTLHIASPGNDSAEYLGIDSLKNMLVVGSTDAALAKNLNLGKDDAYLAKFDANHLQQWITQFGTEAFDAATHMTIDEQDNIYVLGYTDGSIDASTEPFMSDIFIAKFDPNGTQLWVTQFGADQGHEISQGITILNDKLYIAGSSTGVFTGQTQAGEHDYFIAEHDMLTGAQNWLIQAGSTGDDQVVNIGSDNNGNIILAVTEQTILPDEPFSAPESFIKIYAYAVAGSSPQISWQSNLKSEGLSYFARGFAVLGNSIYISGERFPNASFSRPIQSDEIGSFVAKFDANTSGTPVWDVTIDSNNGNIADSVVIDELDNIYVAGFVFDFPPFFGDPLQTIPAEEIMKISVKKLDSSANELWSAEITASDHASVRHMLLDPDGTTLHLVGIAHGDVDGNSLIGQQDGFIAKLSTSTGEIQ